MEESLMKAADETIWFENDEAIQEFLESFRKSEIFKTDHQAEKPSWVKLIEKSIQI